MEKKKVKGEAAPRGKRVVPPGLEILPWAGFYVAKLCAGLRHYALLALFTIVAVGFLWLFQLVPSLPPSPTQYCAFQFFMVAPVYIVNLFLPAYSHVAEFYLLGMWMGIFALAIEVWIAADVGWAFYQCTVGAIASTCGGAYLIDSLVAVLIIVLGWAGLNTVFLYFDVLTQTSNTHEPSRVRLTAI